MKVVKKIFVFFLCLAIILGAGVYYVFQVEPYRLNINEYTWKEELAGEGAASKVTIAQISDVHVKEDFTYKNFSKFVNELNSQNPDIVLFTGDLYDNFAMYNDNSNIIAELQKIEAKYAKIAIWGNRDYGGGAVREYEGIMESAGFTLLKNENWYVTFENGKNILFTGLDDSLMGNPSMPDATKIYESDYDILLTHEPDVLEKYMEYPYDLILSGHSHGGQVDIPFMSFINERALESTSLSSKYSDGMHLPDEAKGKRVYVNTGIGTTHMSVRFGVVPEIALFHIYM